MELVDASAREIDEEEWVRRNFYLPPTLMIPINVRRRRRLVCSPGSVGSGRIKMMSVVMLCNPGKRLIG